MRRRNKPYESKQPVPTGVHPVIPSEKRIRAWLLALLALVGPPLLLALYYRTMFPGLTSPDALDFAQLGRNVSAGHGFTTYLLRPLALNHGNNPLTQPDMTHGPLYPFLLALAYGLLGARDAVTAWVSGLFYLLTIPMVYLLGRRVFNHTVGLITALIFLFNALLLEYAASGMHLTLYIFLMTGLLLTAYHLAARARDDAGRREARLPRGMLVMTGVLTALLYLTDPIFFWITPVMLVAVAWLHPTRRMRAILLFLVPLLVLAGPWMIRNAVLSGNPIFGLRGAELWMNTKNQYPGLSAYRLSPDEMTPGEGLFKAVVQKILLGAGQVIQTFPQVTASWVLAFLLPSLLFPFTDPAANTLRRVMMFCFLGLLTGMLLFGINMPLFVSIIPTMLVYSVAYMLHLIRQARLNRSGLVSVAALIALAVVYPLASDTMLIDRTPRLKEADTAQTLGKNSKPGDVIISDQPWIVAWYANRPSLWIPETDARISELRQRFVSTRWLMVTEKVQAYSPQWQYLYGVFRQWNMACARARETNAQPPGAIRIGGKGIALAEALNGFVSVEPVDKAAPTTLVAFAPERRVGLR